MKTLPRRLDGSFGNFGSLDSPKNVPGPNKVHVILLPPSGFSPFQTAIADGEWGPDGKWISWVEPDKDPLVYNTVSQCDFIVGNRWNFIGNNCYTAEQFIDTGSAFVEQVQGFGKTYFDATGREFGMEPSLGFDRTLNCIRQPDGTCSNVPAELIPLVNQYGITKLTLPENGNVWATFKNPSLIRTYDVYVPAVLSTGPRWPTSQERLLMQGKQDPPNCSGICMPGAAIELGHFKIQDQNFLNFWISPQSAGKLWPALKGMVFIQPYTERSWLEQIGDNIAGLFSDVFSAIGDLLSKVIPCGPAVTALSSFYPPAAIINSVRCPGQGGANPNNCPLTETAVAANGACVCLKEGYEYDSNTRTCKKKPSVLPWIVGGVLGAGAIVALLAVKSRKAK